MSDQENQFLKAYDAYSESIYRHCFFRVWRKGRAEELLQETFLRLWTYLIKGNKVENIRALLYKIANNLIIDESRKKKEESLDQILENPERLEPKSNDHQDIEKNILIQEVLGQIQVLEDEDRNLLIMRFIDDLDPRDIAEILNISANNVSVKINRALKNLKEKFN
ncbi:MAG: sigma-70 family RNA polymerase sigma factor [bacterium]|nr:sigma-70 family RNA polymerase sigma factor [bacterium]